MHWTAYSLLLISMIFNLSCRDDDDRFERIDKLRAIGVKTNTPIVSSSKEGEAAKSVELTFYLALPKGEVIDSFESAEIDPGIFYVPQSVEVLSNSLTYEEYAGLDLASFKATMEVPLIEESLFVSSRGVVRLRYSVLVKSKTESEKIIGDVRVVRDDDPALNWSSHALSLNSPDASTIKQEDEVSLTGTLTKSQDELVKVIWFVSSGEVENLQALNTTWSKQDTGNQTILLSIFPRKSLFFDFIVKDVTVE